MSHFLPFYVQHSKGFISRLVEIARCGHYAVITTHLTVIKGGLQLDLIKIFLKLKAIFVKENLRFKTLIYISFSYIKSLSDFYHYGESWRRSGNTTLEPCHVRSWNGRQCSRSITRTSQSITTEPSHRFTGAYQSLFLRLFWLGHRSPLNTSKTAYKRF